MGEAGWDVRKRCREGGDKDTSGCAPGYLQANIVILPKQHADDFHRFVNLNPKPCPLLYRSKAGQFTAPPLTHPSYPSDIRTDVPKYRFFQHGELVGEGREKEKGEGAGWWNDDCVVFYFGCSFSFEDALLRASIPIRNIEEGKNVSMFKTSLPCPGPPSFACNLVVSMRPMPPSMVDQAVQITSEYALAHGGPVHVGCPEDIGIMEDQWASPPYGDKVTVKEGEVPLFWACGVTSSISSTSAKDVTQVVTHAPGCMFVTDVVEQEGKEAVSSLSFVKKREAGEGGWGVEVGVGRLEALVQSDPGERGIKHLHKPGELFKAAMDLYSAHHIAITTGFPCLFPLYSPPTETDGLQGTSSLVYSLLRLGKRVTVITDDCNVEPVKAAVDAVCGKMEGYNDFVDFLFVGPSTDLTTYNVEKWDHLLAIERSGRTAGGTYHTMSGKEITNVVGGVDDLFLSAQKLTREGKKIIKTTGIGDGGNELGMGAVEEQVKKHIKNGEIIACHTATDNIVTAGVSDWGGWALSASLALLASADNWCDPLSVFYSEEDALTSLAACVKSGARDGITAEANHSIDGLDFFPQHQILMESLRAILEEHSQKN